MEDNAGFKITAGENFEGTNFEDMPTQVKSSYLETFKAVENLLKGYLHFGLKVKETKKGIIFGTVEKVDDERGSGLEVDLGVLGLSQMEMTVVHSVELAKIIEKSPEAIGIILTFLKPALEQNIIKLLEKKMGKDKKDNNG